MQTFEPNAVAALASLAVAAALSGAGLLIRRASRSVGNEGASPSLDKVQDAPYHRLGNNIRMVD